MKLFSFTGKKEYEAYEKYEKYREYLQEPVRQGKADMSAAGWKMLIEEELGPLIERELGLKYLGNRIWASDYQDHCRKVFGLFLVNPCVATFQWGWNFDFIPVAGRNHTEAHYARTDKSIRYHFYEVPTDFYRITDKRDRTTINDFHFELKDFGRPVEERVRQHQEILQFVLPQVRAFYESTSDYEGKLQAVREQRENSYYSFINPDLVLVQIFLEYYLGDTETAKEHFEALKFKKEKLKSSYYDKLLKVEPGR